MVDRVEEEEEEEEEGEGPAANGFQQGEQLGGANQARDQGKSVPKVRRMVDAGREFW